MTGFRFSFLCSWFLVKFYLYFLLCFVRFCLYFLQNHLSSSTASPDDSSAAEIQSLHQSSPSLPRSIPHRDSALQGTPQRFLNRKKWFCSLLCFMMHFRLQGSMQCKTWRFLSILRGVPPALEWSTASSCKVMACALHCFFCLRAWSVLWFLLYSCRKFILIISKVWFLLKSINTKKGRMSCLCYSVAYAYDFALFSASAMYILSVLRSIPLPPQSKQIPSA